MLEYTQHWPSLNSSIEECHLAIVLLLAPEQLIWLLLEELIQVGYELVIRDYLESPYHTAHVDVQDAVVKVKAVLPLSMDVATEMYRCCQARRVYPCVIGRVVRKRD